MGPEKDINNFNPYPGLRPFTPEDSVLFFGREAESNEVIMKLLKNRYITIIGASGSGKSSLIFGGVLPKILNSEVSESPVWRVISVTPGNNPFGNLSAALSNGMNEAGIKSIGEEIIQNRLLENSGSLSDVVRKYMIKQDNKIILVIDQFEELFRYTSVGKSEISAAIIKKFIDLLVKSASVPAENIFIIVIMRSEYLGECSHYKGFTMFVNNSNYIVADMGAENLREVIEAPLKYAGAKIDPELINGIISDFSVRGEQLPVLQHALMRTWMHWKKFDDQERLISKDDYDSIGTINNSILLHLDEVYEDLNQRGKEICTAMFKTITVKGSDNKGLRNPSDFETIKSVAGCSDEELFYVIDKFRNSSRAFIIPEDDVILNGNSVIDIHYECIIRLWNRLKDWIDDEASSKEMYLRLSEASALYQQGKAGLYRPPELLAAIEWRNKNKPSLSWAVQYNPAFERAMVYLRTSENAYLIEEKNKAVQEKRKTRRTWLTTRILGITLLAALGLMFFVYIQKSSAERKSFLAERQRIQAIKGKAVADSFAVIVFRNKVTSDSTAAVALADVKEVKAEMTAADLQRSLAERNAEKAMHQKNLAIEQRDEARRLRMLSIGKSMALKSLQLTGQKDLQALLAYQAFQFNKMNKGPENDADIHAGLYNVALQYGSSNIRYYDGHNSDIRSIAFIPGGKEFFTSGNDGKVIKWSPEKKEQTLQVMYSGNDVIEVMAVSPDASWLACGSSDASIKMIPLKGNTTGYEMTGHKGEIKSLIFSYDGKYLYSASLDGKVLKWDIAAKTSINVSTGLMEITAIDISSKANYIAGIGTNGNVVVWNPERNSENYRIETSGKNVKVVRFNPASNLLAIGESDGTIELWDVGLHKKLTEVKAHDGEVNDIQFNTHLKQMATAGNDKKLKIFNINDPADLTEPPVTLTDNEGFVLVMKFSPDGKIIISGESSGSHNIIGRPSNVEYLAQDMCSMITRNMTQEEWNTYVGKDIPLERTCLDKNFNIKIEQIKSLNK